MKKIINLSLIFGIILSFISMPILSNAATINSNNPINMAKMIKEINFDTNQSLFSKYLDLTKKEISTQNIDLKTSKDNLDFDASKLTEYDGFMLLTIPFKNSSDFNILSNITIAFENEEIVNYSEQQLTESKNHTFWINQFVDGQQARNEDLTIKYISNEETKNSIKELQQLSQQRGLDVACFGAIVGASGGVIAVILKLCGAPCVLAAPICAGCLAGIIVVGGGGIIGAVVTCWK
ncbi:hypothetical protein ACWOFR_08540 [Carnobacterium gallinarum]|uniref:hypothetical protein n=1 Tax=Carnobacterium gallinarum TaxID=2749 RepID=UPI000556F64A|nr:hypothetical protein [Carnobacterium gallinarum]